MAEGEVKSYSDLTLGETMFTLCIVPKNRNIHEIIGILTVSDMVDRYNILIVNKDQMRCFKA